MEDQPIIENSFVLEQPVVEDETPIVVEQPVLVQEPIIESIVEEQPVLVQEPIIESIVVEQPVIEQPVIEQPVIEQPVLVQEPIMTSHPVRSTSDPNTFHIHIPITKQVQYNITGFTVSPNCYVTLGKSVQINISFTTDMGGIFHKNILLEDNDYNSWGLDDDYIYHYIQTNIVDIFKSI